MPTAHATVSVYDVLDGQPFVSILQTDENHTFQADSDGVVAAGDLADFVNDVAVIVGGVQYAYTTSASPSTNQYTLLAGTLNPAAAATLVYTAYRPSSVECIDPNFSGNVGRITITAIDQTKPVKTVTASIGVKVWRATGTVTIYITITFAKAIGGTGSESLNMSATRLWFAYGDEEETTPLATSGSLNSDITLKASYSGPATGNITWSRTVDGTTWTGFTPTLLHATESYHTLTRSSFNTIAGGAGNYITFKATKGSIEDKVSIIRLDYGLGQYTCDVKVYSGNPIFSNNTGSVTLDAYVYKNGVEIPDYHDWTFTWYQGAMIPGNIVTAGVTDGHGVTGCGSRLTVAAAAVPDGGANQYHVVAYRA
jgi:hypothetical protein